MARPTAIIRPYARLTTPLAEICVGAVVWNISCAGPFELAFGSVQPSRTARTRPSRRVTTLRRGPPNLPFMRGAATRSKRCRVCGQIGPEHVRQAACFSRILSFANLANDAPQCSAISRKRPFTPDRMALILTGRSRRACPTSQLRTNRTCRPDPASPRTSGDQNRRAAEATGAKVRERGIGVLEPVRAGVSSHAGSFRDRKEGFGVVSGQVGHGNELALVP